jgi:hypothetical protein
MAASPPRHRSRGLGSSTWRRIVPLVVVVILGSAACTAERTADGGSSEPGAEEPADVGSAAPGAAPDEPEAAAIPPADPGRRQDVVVGNRAEPGRWPVGRAGSVAFDVTDVGLVVAELETADGWSSVVEEQTGSLVVVRFRGPDGVAARFSANLDGGQLEVGRSLMDGLGPSGRVELPAEGHYLVEVDGETPRLAEVVPGEGWMLADQQLDGDRVGFELRLDRGDTDMDAPAVEAASIVVGIEVDDGGAVVTSLERWRAPLEPG